MTIMQMEQIVAKAVIETDRFVLRPLRKSDKGLIEMHAGDARVSRHTSSIPHPLPPGATEAFIVRAQSETTSHHVWAIDGTISGESEVMGVISLEDLGNQRAEIGYWVAPVFWNTGVAGAAVQLLLSRNPLNFTTCFATAFQDNPASARVLIKCGFQYLGDAESYSVARDANVPTWTYSQKL
jgi:RimJ/RimL family protein N-acetyltransferase